MEGDTTGAGFQGSAADSVVLTDWRAALSGGEEKAVAMLSFEVTSFQWNVGAVEENFLPLNTSDTKHVGFPE